MQGGEKTATIAPGDVGSAAVTRKEVQGPAKGTAKGTLPEAERTGEESALGYVAGLYRRIETATDSGKDVIPLLEELMSLGLGAFGLGGLPNFQEDDMLLEDAMMYYAVVGEAYYKVKALLYYCGYHDDSRAYHSHEDGLKLTWIHLVTHKYASDEMKCFVLKHFRQVVESFFSSCLLLAAPRIVPERPVPSMGVVRTLQFSYLNADVLFHLTRLGSAEAYADSGFMLPGFEGEDMSYAIDNMLRAYKRAVHGLAGSGC